jgi:tetratricopeptide (TPR) repeat protein
LNYADALGKNKSYKEAANVLYSIYQLDKKDLETLYYAANFAIEGQDYESSLAYYKELKQQNYTGEGTNYIAKNKASNLDESFGSKETRDNMVKLGTHISPKEEKIPSKKGEIVRNIALILIQQDKLEEAKFAIAEARKENMFLPSMPCTIGATPKTTSACSG